MIEALMKLFRRYLGTDPTDRWPRKKSGRLVFDAGARTLNGVGFGDPIEALIIFGKPDNARPVYYNVFKYIDHGVVFETEVDRVAYMSFIFADELDDEFRSPIVWFQVSPGEFFEISKNTTKDDIVDAFGEPGFFEKDEYELLLTYEHGDLKLEFELDLSERLKRLNVFLKDTTH